ncbi:DUF5132 domain-containing protein [Actinacidiphila yeochonensis]|uniref:DUF5132 domain-containing protein n=1 Tax=Actinacidiphila yeochonensis TaxID=89050 RepID=UPI00055EF42D|nr:DUF5132 domain-containing protein [Actinacidiphila yeochonensis]
MPPVVPPFLIGLIVGPLAKRLVRPLAKGLLKTSVGLALEVKRVAHEANEGLHDLAAEVTAEVVAAQLVDDGPTVSVPSPAAARGTESVPSAAQEKAPASGVATGSAPKGRPVGAGKTS